MKGTTFEGGFREPAVLRYPAMLPPLQRITQQVGTLDVFPTVLELAGVAAPPVLPYVRLYLQAQRRSRGGKGFCAAMQYVRSHSAFPAAVCPRNLCSLRAAV